MLLRGPDGAAPADSLDADGDGVSDALEGFGSFDTDGDGTIDTTTVAVMRIDNVSDAQARKISDILDGDADTTTGNGAWYASGRVKKFGARQNDRRLLIFLSRE